MKIVIIHVGRTSDKRLKGFIDEFIKRSQRFAQVKTISVDSLKGKNASPSEISRVEAQNIFNSTNNGDKVILLDETGKSYTSRQFSKMMSDHFLHHSNRLVFVIGGAYGFGEALKEQASMMISLSAMTFNHELALAVFAEQLYRGLTIIKGHPYHND